MPNLFSKITSLFGSTNSSDESNVADSPRSWQLSLEEAVREASTILAFASRSGITLDPEQMTPILDMCRLIEKGGDILVIDTDNEQKFWQAFSQVVAKIHPVTSDSINATLGSGTVSQASSNFWQKRTIAQRTVFRYGLYSVVILVSIIYFQSYMQMGMTIRNHLDSSFQSQKKAIDELFAAKITVEDNRLKSIGQEGQSNFVKTLYDKYKVELQIAKLRASQDELFSWSKGGGKVLHQLGMESNVQYQHDIPKGMEDWLTKFTNQQNLTKSPEPSQTENDSSSKAASNSDSDTYAQATLKRDESMIVDELKIVVIPTYLALNESEQVLRLISEFVLPLLYGLLGSCAYVLRDLTRSIGSVTFSKATMINYNLRLIMGPLVGIAVGLFFGTPALSFVGETGSAVNATLPASTSSITSLGTVGFAFLAGYSVEVLFSALETLVNAFGNKSQLSHPDRKEAE